MFTFYLQDYEKMNLADALQSRKFKDGDCVIQQVRFKCKLYMYLYSCRLDINYCTFSFSVNPLDEFWGKHVSKYV